MRIAFYISCHGFGHIMRNLPVIAELLKSKEHEIYLVSAAKHLTLAKEYLEAEGLEKHMQEHLHTLSMVTDVGLLVKPGSLALDIPGLLTELEPYVASFPSRIAAAKEWLINNQIDRVVVDIVPWALQAAKEAGIPSFFMASFTWLEQYEAYVPERLLAPFRECFKYADTVLFYGMANKPTREFFAKYKNYEVGFVSRAFHPELVQKIREEYAKEQPMVFLSLGGSNFGIDIDIDVSVLPYHFVTTEGLKLKGDNVTFLPVATPNTQDYIAASDYVISKAGWGSIAEIMLAGKPVAFLERPDVAEDTLYLQELVETKRALTVSVKQLADMGEVLEKLANTDFVIDKYVNGAELVANILMCK